MTRVPLLADARIVVAEVGAEDVVLRPGPARNQLEDVGAAVRDALGFPLAGAPLEQLVTQGGTATIVIEQPSLPIPGVHFGPRHEAIAAVSDELDRLGVQQVTILVAGGLLRRTAPREIGLLVPPEFRRRFRGRVIVHDAEAEDLVELGRAGNVLLRVNPALVETDLVVTVTAAETVLHGGPAALLAASGRSRSAPAAPSRCSRRARRRAGGSPSRSNADSPNGQRSSVSRSLSTRHVSPGRSPVIRTTRTQSSACSTHASAASSRWPRSVRQRILERLPREQTASAVYVGPPSVAHAEALLQGTVLKGIELADRSTRS